jgi:hypothetical protein
MKILYLSKFDLPDFMNDMVFHGLRSLFGSDVIDYNEAWYMYDDFRKYWSDRIPGRGTEYGRGFTLYGRLPKLTIDRTDIENKIKTKYFNKIIYGSVTRNFDHWNLVHRYYNPSDIIFIDGEDNQQWIQPLVTQGTYYKRELVPLVDEYKNYIMPINFCIPKELIVNEVPKKEKDYATIIPGDKLTYIYTEEKPYYEDYKKSYFGVTCKKGGWDCLRHYEILMNGCIPFFEELDQCPKTTMTRFPKKLVLHADKLIKEGNNLSFYEEYVILLLEQIRENLTTEEIAKSLLYE